MLPIQNLKPGKKTLAEMTTRPHDQNPGVKHKQTQASQLWTAMRNTELLSTLTAWSKKIRSQRIKNEGWLWQLIYWGMTNVHEIMVT